MFANKKVFITAIVMLMALLIGVGIVLLVIFNNSGSSSAPSTSTDSSTEGGSSSGPETIQPYSVELNGTNYETGSTNDLRLKVGQEYRFNLNAVNTFDYELIIETFLPSVEYDMKFSLNKMQAEKLGYSIDSNSEIVEYTFSDNKGFKNGFDIKEYRDYFTFKNDFYDLQNFVTNFFGEYVELETFNGFISHDLLKYHYFKMKVRKVSTDELISFVLYFES